MSDPAIVAERLVKRYGSTEALRGLELEVRRGEVFGFLGPNGAGKTTTIRLLLDLLRPTSGSVRVLGLDPRRASVEVRRRTGYLSGDFVVDARQTGDELLRHLARLRGGVPAERIAALAGRLDADLSRRIKGLSRGNRQKLGVIQAFMHDPELLILDEPTSGLDPFLQQTFVEMVEEACAAGTTVFISSHVMSEVQKIADRVGIIRDGRLAAVESVDDLRARAVREVEIVFDDEVPAEPFAALPGVSDLQVRGPVLRCSLQGRADALVKEAAEFGVVAITAEEPDLETLFFHYYDRDDGDA